MSSCSSPEKRYEVGPDARPLKAVALLGFAASLLAILHEGLRPDREPIFPLAEAQVSTLLVLEGQVTEAATSESPVALPFLEDERSKIFNGLSYLGSSVFDRSDWGDLPPRTCFSWQDATWCLHDRSEGSATFQASYGPLGLYCVRRTFSNDLSASR